MQNNEENVEIDKEITVKTQVNAVKIRSLEQVEKNAQLRSERIAITTKLQSKVKFEPTLNEVLNLQV